jgi:hypothetical protein
VTASTSNPCLDAALDVAEKYSWKTFPVHGYLQVEDRCTCGNRACTSPGKHPVTSDGFKSASSDPETLRSMFAQNGMANVALATGWVNQIVVIDIDPDKGGIQTWNKLASDIWDYEAVETYSRKGFDIFFPPTVVARTGRNGLHLFFSHPGEKIRVKNVADPFKDTYGKGVDIRADGGYVVMAPSKTQGEYQWDPAWGIGNIPMAEIPEKLLKLIQENRNPPGERTDTPVGGGAIPNGERNVALARMAGAVRRQGADKPEIMAYLRATNQEKCRPPLPERDLERIANSIMKYAPKDVPYTPVLLPEAPELKDHRKFVAEPDEQTNWLVEDLILAEGITIIGAKAGTGKSTLLRNLGLDIIGRRSSFLDRPIARQGDVACLAFEESEGQVRRQLRMMLGGRDFPYTMYFRFSQIAADPIGSLEMMIQQNPSLVAVFIDPLQHLLRIKNINDYSEVDAAMTRLREIARQYKVSMILSHHMNKNGVALDGLLGSVAFSGGVDTMICYEVRAGARLLSTAKTRYGNPLQEIIVSLDRSTYEIMSEGSYEDRIAIEIADRIEAFIADGQLTRMDLIAKMPDVPTSKLANVLNRMVNEQKLAQEGRGGIRDPFKYSVPANIERIPAYQQLRGIFDPKEDSPGDDIPF